MAAVGAAAGAVFPPAEGGAWGPAPCAAGVAPQTGRLHGAGCGGRRRFRGGRGWRVVACPVPRLPAWKVSGLSPAQAARAPAWWGAASGREERDWAALATSQGHWDGQPAGQGHQ